ncbi:MAG TPA: AraC family transcriptional regulator [Caulobacteraceae bacterium]
MPISVRTSPVIRRPDAGLRRRPAIQAHGADDRIYPPQKIAVLLEALACEGVPTDGVLAGVGLSEHEVADPATRVSLTQVIACCRNAIRLSPDPMFAYRTGLRFHMPAYGMYGFAMLSSMDFRQTMRFAEKYHQLGAPLIDHAFAEEEGAGVWTITPKQHPQIDPILYRHVVELYFGIHTSLHRDVMGPEFAPRELRVTFQPPPDPDGYAQALGTSVRFGQPRNQLVFDADWLDRRPGLGNAVTYSQVREICDRLLDELQRFAGIVGGVRQLLLSRLMRDMSLKDIAGELGVSVRTLRRRLADRGTSYRQIIDDLRREVAIKYLRDTHMTVEDVAFALGFNDAANFRRAFRRWTSATPQHFRQAGGPEAAAPAAGSPGSGSDLEMARPDPGIGPIGLRRRRRRTP